jgi:lipopolysaccharide export system permease protein
VTLTAKKARIIFSNDYKTLIMRLDDGELHQAFATNPVEYRRGKFVQHEVRIPTSGFEFIREDEMSRGDRELSADDLMKYVHSRDTLIERDSKALESHLTTFARQLTAAGGFEVVGDSSNRDTIRMQMVRAELRNPLHRVTESATQISATKRDAGGYLVEVHKKYSLPAACIVFILLGAPLGALARRGGIGMGVGLSIGFFIVYWAFLIGGEKLADRGIISPWSGMWSANIILTVVGLILTNRVMQERQGFGLKWLVKLFKKKKDDE